MTIPVITSISASAMYELNDSKGIHRGALQPVKMGGSAVQAENNCTGALLQQEGLWD